ncbi:MAG: diaminopimelate epimerase [Gammaproteobacteria bacterium]|nr:diaminopimelate epimerase [Gammaproteobacteria bacterium]
MKIEFSKMHGLGNDFVVIDAINQQINLSSEQVRFLADRHFGVGCDQLLLVEKASRPSVDFRYRIFNADGSEVEQCGNGARCFARFVANHGLTSKTEIPVETAGGDIVLRLQDDGQVTVDMGVPRFDPAVLPLTMAARQARYDVEIDGELTTFGAVSMGNPHAVIMVDDVTRAPVDTLGPILESHPLFPRRVNVGFMQVKSADHIALRVYERGAAETLACGTGACGAMVVGRTWGLLDDTVQVDLPGGSLRIHWAGEGHHVMMTGPAVEVFRGMIELA